MMQRVHFTCLIRFNANLGRAKIECRRLSLSPTAPGPAPQSKAWNLASASKGRGRGRGVPAATRLTARAATRLGSREVTRDVNIANLSRDFVLEASSSV